MTGTGSAPRISALQRAWLGELGIPKPMLARYLQACLPGPAVSAAASPAPASDSAPEAKAPAAPRRSRPDVPGRDRPAATPAAPVPAPAPAAPAAGFAPVVRQGGLPEDLAGLAGDARQCRACPLCQGRSRVVFGDGQAPSPEWMVIGEAPGADDDRAGLPFQGDAGELLAHMLRAIGIDAGRSVYFTNLVKCRPLGNRPPSADEIAACLPYLRRQIALVAPRRILALGRLAAQTLVGEGDFDQLRGAVHEFHGETGEGIPLVVTFHPASLLLHPQHKIDAWRDLNRARAGVV